MLPWWQGLLVLIGYGLALAAIGTGHHPAPGRDLT